MTPDLRELYLELVKRSVGGYTHEAAYEVRPSLFERGVHRRLNEALVRMVGIAGRASGQDLALVRRIDEAQRHEGGPWPLVGETMIGLRRLDHLQSCVETILAESVDGDLIEAGVWRGGAAIGMRAVLAANQVDDREVWVADSFSGIPAPDLERHPEDGGYRLHRHPELVVSLERVRANFARYGLLDEQVRFLPGRFRDTLPTLRGHAWSLIRLDGDLSEATHDSLENLYPGLSVGGFLVVDDYGAVPACRHAVDAFRDEHHISEPVRRIDHSAVFWRRTS